MSIKHSIISTLATLPEIANWPEVATFFERTTEDANADWYIPVRTCLAVGGSEEIGMLGAVSVACLQVSIMLVDDMLDEDPRGLHTKWKVGPTANMALALQAAPFRLIRKMDVHSSRQSAITDCLGHMALATATGQYLDTQNLDGEGNYWRVVKAKSTPFYGGAYKVGALLGCASNEVANAFYEFGVLIGEIIQIQDDLDDALQHPANPDWKQGRNNLLLLYARSADYPQKRRLLELMPQVEDESKLTEAQDILVSSGAVSYSLYLLTQKYKQARTILATLDIPDAEQISSMLDGFSSHLRKQLGHGGVDVSEELLDQI